MATIVTIAAACCAAGCIVVQALDVGAKLRLAFFAAQWSALVWVGVRLASMSVNAIA